MLATLKQRGYTPVARLLLFKDPVLAKKRLDLAVQNSKGAAFGWITRGIGWVDPHSREVWEYNLAIAKEAAAMGFPEIQFDYVRFPSDGRLDECLYSHAYGKRKPEGLRISCGMPGNNWNRWALRFRWIFLAWFARTPGI